MNDPSALPDPGDPAPPEAGVPRPLLSVVVPTLGRTRSLGRLLDALDRQTLARDCFEVIVVVNGPQAAAAVAMARLRSRARVVRRDAPGRAGACNTGVNESRGDIIVFLDDDMEPLPTCLAAHAAAHAPPSVGRAAGVRLVLGPVPVVRDPAHGAANAYVAARFERHLQRIAGVGVRIGPADTYTGNASVERAALLAVGGFDASLVEYGNEDRELARRLVSAGAEICLAPEAAARQRYEKDLIRLLDDSRAKGRTAATVAQRNPRAGGDTRLARQPGPRRRLAARFLDALTRLPGGSRLARMGAEAMARMVPGLALPVVELLVDVEFWRGAREPRTADRTRPRVVHLIDSTEFGGAEQVLLQLATGLDPARWESVALVPNGAGRLADRLARAGIPTAFVDLAPGSSWRAVPATASALRRLRPDLVHLQRPWPPAGRRALAAAVLARPRALVVTEHLAPGQRSLKGRALDRILALGVTRWIAVSPDVGRWVASATDADPTRIRVVTNGVEPSPPAAVGDAPAIGPTPDGPLRVAMIAQLRPQKGHDVLLDAVARISDPVLVTLAGVGPEQARIAERIRQLGLGSRVQLVGFVEDVSGLLGASDVVVLPSRFEGLPLAVLEAMAAGRAVIGSRVPGTADVIDDGRTGLLVPPADPAALASAIERLARDPELRTRLGDAGRARVAQRYDVRATIRSVEAVYRGALAARATKGRGRTTPTHGRSATGRATGPAAASPEARLDALLRPVDLRVLAGQPAPARAAATGRGQDDLVEALALVAGHAEPLDTGAGPVYDLLVARDPDPLATRAAIDGLAPGGGLLVLMGRSADRPRILGTMEAAGLIVVDCYRPWPTSRRPRAWLPYGVGSRELARLTAGRNPVRTGARRGSLALWRASIALGRAPLAIVARRPVVPTEAATLPDPIGGLGSPDSTRWMLLTGGRRSHNRIVALGFTGARSNPSLAATFARVPGSVDGLRREATALRAVHALRPGGVAGVPRLVLERGEGLASVVVQEAIDGAPLSVALRHRSFDWAAGLVGDWLMQLRRPGETVSAAMIDETIVEPRIGWLVERHGVLEPDLAGRLRAALADLGPVPRAVEHRDLAPWNMRVLPDGGLAVLDWESAEPDGIAGPDVHYALAHLAFDVGHAHDVGAQLRVYRSLRDPRSTLGRSVDRVLDRYAEQADLARRDLDRLALVAWLVHARSEYERLASDLGAQAAAAELPRGLFLGLLEIALDDLA